VNPAHVHPLAMPSTQGCSPWCRSLSLAAASLGSRDPATLCGDMPRSFGALGRWVPASVAPYLIPAPRRGLGHANGGVATSRSRPFTADRVVPFPRRCRLFPGPPVSVSPNIVCVCCDPAATRRVGLGIDREPSRRPVACRASPVRGTQLPRIHRKPPCGMSRFVASTTPATPSCYPGRPSRTTPAHREIACSVMELRGEMLITRDCMCPTQSENCSCPVADQQVTS